MNEVKGKMRGSRWKSAKRGGRQMCGECVFLKEGLERWEAGN
jgi:hypothetical protein